jgi:hypothetical protein
LNGARNQSAGDPAAFDNPIQFCLPRHSIGYDALDLAISSADEKRAFTCSENELQDVIQSVEHKFPLGKALATLIRQQWQARSKSQKKKPKKPKKR